MNVYANGVSRFEPDSQVRDAHIRFKLRLPGSRLIAFSEPLGADNSAVLEFRIGAKQEDGDRTIITAEYTFNVAGKKTTAFCNIELCASGEINQREITSGTTLSREQLNRVNDRINDYLPFVYNGVSV